MSLQKMNWKTTLAGIFILVGSAGNIINKPSDALNMQNVGQIVTGLGLIVAKDSDKTGVGDNTRGKD